MGALLQRGRHRRIVVEDGRGQKPAFSPTGEEKMGEKLRELVSRSPRALGYDRSRWTLQLLREHLQEHLGEEDPETDAGLSRMLDRLGITYSRGQ
jgi:transposase